MQRCRILNSDECKLKTIYFGMFSKLLQLELRINDTKSSSLTELKTECLSLYEIYTYLRTFRMNVRENDKALYLEIQFEYDDSTEFYFVLFSVDYCSPRVRPKILIYGKLRQFKEP